MDRGASAEPVAPREEAVAAVAKSPFRAAAALAGLACWPPLSMQMTAPFRMPMSGT
jgi:hypothetical protein